MEQIVKIHDGITGERIDRALQSYFPEHSRSYLQQLIVDKYVMVNDAPIKKTGLIVKPGDRITIGFPLMKVMGALPLPEHDLGVSLLYEHEEFLIVYKPAGLLVHAPTHNSTTVTLVDWLVHSFKELSQIGATDRPGIVHRLDKDTSGILIIPRTPQSHAHISALFQTRQMEKTYLAVVSGHPPKSGTIDFSVGRHPHHKHKMTHLPCSGSRDAVTHYEVRNYFKESALIEVHPVTGRTHQIRVHCAAIGHPVLGDLVYGKEDKRIGRQALHAHQISFMYKDVYYSIWRDMPDDMRSLIAQLGDADPLEPQLL